MTENPILDTSLCKEKHQSLGVLRGNQLWHSSCVAEYIPTSMCACQVVWLMNFMKELCNEKYEVLTLIRNHFRYKP